MSTNKLLLGILAGLAIGATAGILMAPDKGSNTRKKISKKGNDYVDRVGSEFNSIIENITTKADHLKAEVAHLMENGQPTKGAPLSSTYTKKV